ncbi:FAD/NAD(P)-binding domain-containing protein [Daldinia vernicosa]|uniref:FAD/NAD(P)-binding domain-containing protein n=1 Tax=Daldinia vernicosa TaxID=114800 RepID=UPI0020075A4E|nr:FAD/NAD(P)-binding domain-containing protein [Daldinia vernicosa]KAI0848040.1 FAD/NAD(P)-binding domain-containing protein [Daldinia vernicosa]
MDKSGNAIQPSDMIAIIGCGLGGIAMAVQLKRLLRHDNFRIYEKGDDIGGTWARNRYPNLSCDVPSEFYSFSFFQNPEWSEKFASQQEILDYIHNCAHHFQLASHISLQHECRSISWSESQQLWIISLRDKHHNKTFEVQSRYVVTATGVLNIPNRLDGLSALESFGGQCFHTGEWREINFDEKRVMVIGNGCSANQIIPWILNNQRPRSLVQLARSEQWVAPKGNFKISAFTKWCCKYIPFFMKIRRLWTAYQLDHNFVMYRNTTAGAKARTLAAEGIKSYMTSVANPAYRDILLPRYELGAKRAVMDHGYLEATNRPNFKLVKCNGIVAVQGPNNRTIIDEAGNYHTVDVVVVANGFKTQDLLTPMEVRGIDDQDLRDIWRQRGGSEAYMGVSVSGFPNFFMLAGPNTLPSGNSTLHGIECSVIYILRVLRGTWGYGRRTDDVSIMVKAEAEARFNERIQNDISGLVYSKDVSTWYIKKETGKNTLIWPGTQFSFWWSRCISAIKWSDWTVERR